MTNRILDWRIRRSWLTAVRHYAGDMLTSELRAHLLQTRAECWSDNMSWLPDPDDFVLEFSSRLTSYYSHVKGFHGCRPTRLQDYYEHGIVGQRNDYILQTFREIFSDRPALDLDNAIKEMENRGATERGKIWFLARDSTLLSECGHYIIQGSEYLMSLAATLCDGKPGSEDYRFRLRRFGVPTILEVNIPIDYVPAEQQLEVARIVLSEWGQIAARRPLGFNEEPCYVIRQDIEPRYIGRHYHPRTILDPHSGYREYINKIQICDMSEHPLAHYRCPKFL